MQLVLAQVVPMQHPVQLEPLQQHVLLLQPQLLPVLEQLKRLRVLLVLLLLLSLPPSKLLISQ